MTATRRPAGTGPAWPSVLTLYGSPGSGSAAVEAALAVCGLAHDTVRASEWEADSAIETLRRVNPLAQIPTLVWPDGLVMTESAAILIHLGLTHPDSGLLPSDPAARARALRALVFIAANLYAAISVIDYPQRWTTASTRPAQDKVRQGARQRLHAHWLIFADQFGADLLQAGGAPAAIDLLAAVVAHWSGARAHLAKHRPAVLESLQRTEAHPRVAAVFRRHWPES